MKEQIVHETATHHVLKIAVGHYEVYRNGVTAATRCGTYHFSNDDRYAIGRAILECDRMHRDSAKHTEGKLS